MRSSRHILTCVIACLSLVMSSAVMSAEEKKANPPDLAAKVLGVQMQTKHQHTKEQAETARSIGQDIVCLCGTCPKRTITNCECGWALQNQNALVNALVAGHTPEKIVSAYRSAYGDSVLAMLPNEGFATAAWALPYTVAGLALFVVFFLGIRFMRKPATVTAMTDPDSENLPEVTDDEEARAALKQELEDLD